MVEPKNSEIKQRREEREKYYQRKEKLVELEKQNFDRIIFLRATGGFWVVCGHSAVILANKIGKELKIRVPLKRDTDFSDRFKEGKISVKNLDYYKRELVGGKMATILSEDKDFVVFKLKKKVGAKEYELLAQAKELRRQQFEKEILKTVPMPRSHLRLTEALRTAFRTYNKYTDKGAKEVFGLKLMDELRTAHKVFLLVCMNELPLEAGLKKIDGELTRALAGVTQMVELDIWTIEDAMAVATAIVESKTSLRDEQRMVKKLLAKLRTEEFLNGEAA
ncbi:hypothetical protein IKF74_00295 [Candidatus Saccharibacteria bacterium]|nr:hypothetical protein [Candidatus Saccharibacteria bacterium]